MQTLQDESNDIGASIYGLASELFPINRSITGDGVRETLKILKIVCPGLAVHEVPSGTKAFDWTVPKEWNVREAFIERPDGRRIAEFLKNNLHLVGYSTPVDCLMPLAELQKYLHSLPHMPSAVPYVTSYYEERFGFCLSHEERASLTEGEYRVYIDSELKDGALAYGEAVFPGESDEEIFFSAYICHPSMANDNLSGPCIAAHVAAWVADAPRRYSYRFVFVPETIGSITYMSRNLDALKSRVIAGFNLSCLGDPGHFSYIASRYANTLADRAAKSVLKFFDANFKSFSFLCRGSDERQYNAPGVDLPLCGLTRTRFGDFPQYHTSADDMNFITPDALAGSFALIREIVESLEANRRYRVKTLCEPQLSPRGLYPSMGTRGSAWEARSIMNFMAYCDGANDLFRVSEIIGEPALKLADIAKILIDAELLEEAPANDEVIL
ncbi:MAG: DUF4910 domain-containing protein [Synergistaceae bacterium]|nr:DUF4910 domain-containing protein [Synergistaceae bacterium]